MNNEEIDDYIDKHIDDYIDSQINEQINAHIDEQINAYINGHIDKQINQQLDEELEAYLKQSQQQHLLHLVRANNINTTTPTHSKEYLKQFCELFVNNGTYSDDILLKGTSRLDNGSVDGQMIPLEQLQREEDALLKMKNMSFGDITDYDQYKVLYYVLEKNDAYDL